MEPLQALDSTTLILLAVAVAVLLLAVVAVLSILRRGRAQAEPSEPAASVSPVEQRLAALATTVRTQGERLDEHAAELRSLRRRAEPPPEAGDGLRSALLTGGEAAARVQGRPGRDQVMSDYRAAFDDLSGAGERFIEAHRPQGAKAAGEGAYQLDGDARAAFLWAVEADGGWLLLPGYRALKDWSSLFSPQREQNAREHFGQAFDLDPSSTRFDAQPARAEGHSGRLRLLQRGRITGFRS